jgi:site-specific recombinase XerD
MIGGKFMLPDYVCRYFESLIANGRENSTLARYESDINKFFDWLSRYKGDNHFDTLNSLTDNDYQRYFNCLEQTNLSAATIKRLVTVLNGLLRYLNIKPSNTFEHATKSRPLRFLTQSDFISEGDFEQLLKSMRTMINDSELAARDYLISRNVSIVYLMRYYGLTPTDIHKIDMNDINFAQDKLLVHSTKGKRELHLEQIHIQEILNYYNSIPKLFRSKNRTDQPLYVAFNNVTMGYQYDYVGQRPKRLSVRAIQEMVKDEVRRSGLRKLSAATLRNSAILEQLNKDCSAHEVITYFGLSNVYSLRRYEKYLEYLKSSAD